MTSREGEKYHATSQYLDDVALNSRSWIGDDALLSAALSSDLDDEPLDADDYDDISSLSFSDLSSAAHVFQPAPSSRPTENVISTGESAARHIESSENRSSDDQISMEEVRHREELLQARIMHSQRRHAEQLRLCQAHHASQIEQLAMQLDAATRKANTLSDQLESVKVNLPICHGENCATHQSTLSIDLLDHECNAYPGAPAQPHHPPHQSTFCH